MKMLLSVLLLVSVVSCANQKPDKRDKSHTPPHGGVVIKGHKYYLEIVGSDKHVHLYPLQENEEGNLVTIPLKNVRMEAEYSPERSKADYSLNLNKRHEHYYGKVDKHGEETYQVHVDMKVGKTQESFIYNLRTKDLVHKKNL
jgi:hypothetical protein